MTTTTDTLTRWLPLYEQDESLRPEGTYVTYNSDGQPFLMYGTKKGGGMGLGPIADMAIRDTAVRWLRLRGMLTFHQQVGSLIFADCDQRLSYDMDNDGDALYAACKAVLAGDKT